MSNNSVQVKANRKWKVLVVDCNRICLMILEKILQSCNYQVTTCQNAQEAVSLLQDQNDFDIMMIDVYMEHMNGLELVKHVCEQTNLPVIAMSSNDDEDIIKEGFKSGACDYLVKPIRVENVRHIWMNVCRAQRQGLVKKVEQSWSNSVSNMINESNSVDYQMISENGKSSSDGEDSKCAKKRKLIKYHGEDNQQDNDVGSTRRKKRVIWTPELHLKFVEAMNQIGNNSKAVPKKILELMNVPGLTRENVASHLQKYRQYHKRLEHNSHKQSRKTMNLVSSEKQSYQTMSSTTNRHNNVQAQVIATSSLQVRSIPSPKEISFGSEITLEHRKHISGVEEILSFNQPQPQQIMGQMTQTMKFHALANNETMATIRENPRRAADGNLAIVEHGNVIYHPFASYAYSKIDSKTHLIGTPWNPFCMEDNKNVKREATSFFVREMTSSIGGQHYGDDAYENVVDLGYNNDASSYIDEQVDPNVYPCN